MAAGVGRVDSKINVWVAAIKLKVRPSAIPNKWPQRALTTFPSQLNLTIVQIVLPGLKDKATWPDWGPPRKGPRVPDLQTELGCTAAFHHSVNAAWWVDCPCCEAPRRSESNASLCLFCSTILQSMTGLEERRLLSFAADTFLHFAIYSAFFLWTLCRDVGPELLEPG